MTGAPLGREAIGQMILRTPPLVEGFLSLADQLQPNGFDLTLRDVGRFASPGSMGSGAEQRELSAVDALDFGPDGWLQLAPGPYIVTLNEIVSLPLDILALAWPRSSLLRSGVSIHTGVGDAGYRGRPQALLTVHNPGGYRVQRGARLLQLVFFRLDHPVAEGYRGRFMDENL